MLAQRNFLSYASCITTRGTCPGKPAGPRRIKDTWHRGTPDLYFAELSSDLQDQGIVKCFRCVPLSLGMGGWGGFGDRRRAREAGDKTAI